MNFGHAIWEDLGGVFHAMHLFDLPRDDGRVIFTNSHHINRNQQFLFPRIPVYIDEYCSVRPIRRVRELSINVPYEAI
jgi:hypothetical protein